MHELDFTSFIQDESLWDAAKTVGRGLGSVVNAASTATDAVLDRGPHWLRIYPKIVQAIIINPKKREEFWQKWERAAEEGRIQVAEQLGEMIREIEAGTPAVEKITSNPILRSLIWVIKAIANFFHLPQLTKMIPLTIYDTVKAGINTVMGRDWSSVLTFLRHVYNVTKVPVAIAMTGLSAVTAYQQLRIVQPWLPEVNLEHGLSGQSLAACGTVWTSSRAAGGLATK
jgi:hypothetical protein